MRPRLSLRHPPLRQRPPGGLWPDGADPDHARLVPRRAGRLAKASVAPPLSFPPLPSSLPLRAATARRGSGHLSSARVAPVVRAALSGTARCGSHAARVEIRASAPRAGASGLDTIVAPQLPTAPVTVRRPCRPVPVARRGRCGGHRRATVRRPCRPRPRPRLLPPPPLPPSRARAGAAAQAAVIPALTN